MQSILFPRAYSTDYKIKSLSSYKGFNRYTIDFNSIYRDVFTLGLSHFQRGYFLTCLDQVQNTISFNEKNYLNEHYFQS